MPRATANATMTTARIARGTKIADPPPAPGELNALMSSTRNDATTNAKNRDAKNTKAAARRTKRLLMRQRSDGPLGGQASPCGHHGGRFPVVQERLPHVPRRRSGGTLGLVVGEAIADAIHGQQVTRLAGIGLELAADVLHVRVDGAFVGLEFDAVHRVEQLRAREDAAGRARERDEELELRRRKLHRTIADAP